MIGAVLTAVFGTMLAAGIIIELCAALKAPLGYQDETGFHMGVKPFAESDGFSSANPGGQTASF